jgi:hypothetical protein
VDGAADWEHVCWTLVKILNKFIFEERHMSNIHQVV